MVPSLVAVGTYSLLLAWNEYLYAFLLLSNDTDVTLRWRWATSCPPTIRRGSC